MKQKTKQSETNHKADTDGGSERRVSLQSFLEFVGRETRGYLRDTGRTAEDFESFDTD